MKFTTSLKKNHEFKRLYSRGKSAASKYVVVYCRKNGKNENRLGITVTTKLGGAVKRNRVRRRLKEVYSINEPALRKGYDIVLVARMRCVGAPWRELEPSLMYLLKKLGLQA